MSRLSIGERLQKSWRWIKGEKARTCDWEDSHRAKPNRIGYADRRRKTIASSPARAARNHARLVDAVAAAKRSKSVSMHHHVSLLQRQKGPGAIKRWISLQRDTSWRFRERMDHDLERWDRKIANLKVELGRAAAQL